MGPPLISGGNCPRWGVRDDCMRFDGAAADQRRKLRPRRKHWQ